MERTADAELRSEGVEAIPRSLWERMRAEPERAPEHVALAAAERFGPAAERWVALNAGHEPEKMAKIAYRKHVRLARLEGAALGVGGAVTALPDLGALAWVQSRMVFFIAASYRYDPRHPMRPAELLALQDVYDTPAAARAALDGMGPLMARALVERRLSRSSDEQLATRLLKLAARRVAKRAALRVVPFIASPIAAIQNGGATKELGQRALAYYRG